MKTQKGFTLIELLAVIVILAIIALIATPMILGVINKAKVGAAESSALGYLDAFEKQMIINITENKVNFSDGTYAIGGAFLTDNKISYKGEGPTKGQVVIVQGKINSAELCIQGYNITYTNGKAKNDSMKEYCSNEDYKDSVELPTEDDEIVTSKYANGTIVYFDPTNGKVCDESTYNTNTNKNANTGCMKWYMFNNNDTDTTINMILDHNTTNLVAWNNDRTATVPLEALNQINTDTNGWVTGLNPRMITADEVAKIVNKTGWTSTVAEPDPAYFYLVDDGKVCTEGNTSGCDYGWLYDKSGTSCLPYGCPSNPTGTTNGYWTSSLYTGTAGTGNSKKAYLVSRYASLTFDDVIMAQSYGVRPVITVSKSIIS